MTAILGVHTNPQLQVNSDTMTFVFKSTAINSGDPIGTFNTYLKPINTGGASTTLNATAPTQTPSSMNTNGVLVQTTPYGSASTTLLPSRFDIKIGTGLTSKDIDAYAGLGKTTQISYDGNNNQQGAFYGMRVLYNTVTGILTFDGAAISSNTASQQVGQDNAGNGASGAYFVFNASKF
jgi:hypothetical protein